MINGAPLNSGPLNSLGGDPRLVTLVEKIIGAGVPDSTYRGTLPLAEALSLASALSTGAQVLLAASIQMAEGVVERNRVRRALQEGLILPDTLEALARQLATLSATLATREDLHAVANVTLSEALTLAQQLSAWQQLRYRLRDKLTTQAAAVEWQRVHADLLASLQLLDTLARYLASLSDTLTATDQTAGQWRHLLALVADLALNSLPDARVLVAFPLADDLQAQDGLSLRQRLRISLDNGLMVQVGFALDGAQYVAYAMNTRNFAVSQYQQFPFHAFGRFQGVDYGANANGLYRLDGQTDDGALIDARIRSATLALGSGRLTRIQAAYLAMRTDAVMGLKLISDDGISRWYRFTQDRVVPAQGVTSRYWTLDLVNVDGSDFAVDRIDLIPLVLERRR